MGKASIKVKVYPPDTRCNRNRDGLTRVDFGGSKYLVTSVNLAQAGKSVLDTYKELPPCGHSYIANRAQVVNGILNLS